MSFTLFDLARFGWRLALLMYLPMIAAMIAAWLADRVRDWRSSQAGHGLPHDAGTWLRRQLAASGLSSSIEVVAVSDKLASDGYDVAARTIMLEHDTYFARDPQAWAIAGHELGHALVRIHRRWLAAILDVTTRVVGIARSLGLGLLAGNLLFGLPASPRIGLWFLVFALVCDGVRLLDEALASGDAASRLASTGMLSRRERWTAHIYLIAAFATYASAFVAHAAAIALWPRLVASAPFAAWCRVGGLPPHHHVMVMLACVYGLAVAGYLVYASVRRERPRVVGKPVSWAEIVVLIAAASWPLFLTGLVAATCGGAGEVAPRLVFVLAVLPIGGAVRLAIVVTAQVALGLARVVAHGFMRWFHIRIERRRRHRWVSVDRAIARDGEQWLTARRAAATPTTWRDHVVTAIGLSFVPLLIWLVIG